MNDDFANNLVNARFRNRTEAGDVYEYNTMVVYGFGLGDAIRGFAWIDWRIDFSAAYIPLARHYVGLLKDEYVYEESFEEKVPQLSCGYSYLVRNKLCETFWEEGNPADRLLVEKDDSGRITFCGMQENGVRLGPGSEFRYDEENRVEEVRGLWHGMQLTHKLIDGKLVEQPCKTEKGR